MTIHYEVKHPNGAGVINVTIDAPLDATEIDPEELEDEILGYVENDLFMNIEIKDFDWIYG